MSYAQALAEQPGKPIPELFTRKYDIDATYDLLDRPEVTPDAIQAGSSPPGQGRVAARPAGTCSSRTRRSRPSPIAGRPVPGLGPIGGSEEGQQGFLLHSVLAVRAPLPAEPDASGRRPPVDDPGPGRPAVPGPLPPPRGGVQAGGLAAADRTRSGVGPLARVEPTDRAGPRRPGDPLGPGRRPRGGYL